MTYERRPTCKTTVMNSFRPRQVIPASGLFVYLLRTFSSASAGSERPIFRQRVISDRVMTRRRSEMSLEVIRVCAEARKQKLARLLKEHEELVRSIEVVNPQA